jgi:hypothetical protein
LGAGKTTSAIVIPGRPSPSAELGPDENGRAPNATQGFFERLGSRKADHKVFTVKEGREAASL